MRHGKTLHEHRMNMLSPGACTFIILTSCQRRRGQLAEARVSSVISSGSEIGGLGCGKAAMRVRYRAIDAHAIGGDRLTEDLKTPVLMCCAVFGLWGPMLLAARPPCPAPNLTSTKLVILG